MHTTTQTYQTTGTRIATWAGYILSALSSLFLLFDAGIKVAQLAPAIEATTQLGLAAPLVMPLGLVQMLCLLLALYRRTAVLGAVLLTGYLGGAIATHLHAGSGAFSLVFPAIVSAMVWGGLWLRDPALRTVLPLRQ